MKDRNVALDFFDHWLATGMVDAQFFSEDFIFLCAVPKVDASVWMMNDEVELPLENPVLIDTIVSGTSTVLLFDGIDLVTALNYRTAWFFLIREQKITRLTEVRQTISPYPDIAKLHAN